MCVCVPDRETKRQKGTKKVNNKFEGQTVCLWPRPEGEMVSAVWAGCVLVWGLESGLTDWLGPNHTALLATAAGLAGFAEASLQARDDRASTLDDALSSVHHRVGSLLRLIELDLEILISFQSSS